MNGFSFYSAQTQIEKTTATSYDIYRDSDKIANVHNYDALKQFIMEKYKDKIAVGNGEIFFDDSISVVEKYDTNITEHDSTETYERIANEVQFIVSAIQVIEVDSGDTYYVPNLQIWENSLTKIQNALSNNDINNAFQLKSQTEFTMTETEVENILSEQEIIKQMMHTQDMTYTTVEGDTLDSVAAAYGINKTELLLLNPQYNEADLLLTGITLNVTTPEYQNKFTKISIITRNEPILYDIEYIDDDTMFTNQEEIITPGVDGEEVVQISVKYTDEGEEILLNRATLMIVTEPVTQVVRRGTKEASDIGTGTFIFPTASRRTSAEYGDDYLYGQYRFHYGLDINEGLNANIMAADNGVVITSEYNSSYGNYIIIDHNNGYYTLYAHLNKSDVRVGQVVRQGEVIGYMGSTGLSTGIHLHFEVRVGGNTREHAKNPREYIGY